MLVVSRTRQHGAHGTDSSLSHSKGRQIVTQVQNIGIKRHALEYELDENGYWGNSEREKRYAYVLSPSAYVMTAAQAERLDRLAHATYGAVKNLSERLTDLATRRTTTNEEAQFVSMARNASRGLMTPDETGGAVPPVIKVDLMQDAEGCYRIAEVDSYNPRGLCYLALLERTVPKGMPRIGSGMVEFASMLKSVGDPEKPWRILVSDFERFYAPAFDILASSVFYKNGMNVRALDESGIKALVSALPADEALQVLMIPESIQDIALRDCLLGLYRQDRLRTLYAPTAYLGSKAFLPYLRSQPGMDEFIPRSSFVSKKHDPLAGVNGTPVVLKGCMSSGLKQVVFSARNQERFLSEYAAARKTKRPVWVLQEEVRQASFPVEVFTGPYVPNKEVTTVQEYFLRLTAYVTQKGILGVEVTGRPEPDVHGAPDCIQIPVVRGF